MLQFRFGARDLEEYEDTSSWELYTLTTRNLKHRFGKARIHVGSTKDEVIEAFSKATPLSNAGVGEEYYDGFWDDGYVRFTYDENDIVTSIEFTV